MRNSERLYYENQLELQKHDLRKSWKIMKEIIGKVNESDETILNVLLTLTLTLTLKRVYFDNNEYCKLRNFFFLNYIRYNAKEQAWCQ